MLNKSLIKKQIFDCIFYHNKKSVKKIVVMLHGYGADNNDLAPIAEYLHDDVHDADWIFPNGILKLEMGPYSSGRAWFPIDMLDLEGAIREKNFDRVFCDKIPQGLHKICEELNYFIEDLADDYDEIILSGFSQGSMVTLGIFLGFFKNLSPSSKITKIGLLSSTLVAQDWTSSQLEKIKQNKPNKPKIFQSHGSMDPVLPFENAKKLKNLLDSFGFEVDYHEFMGTHEIPKEILKKFAIFINR